MPDMIGSSLGDHMTITVLLFAAARELVGNHRVVVELPDASTVKDLKSKLQTALPMLASLLTVTRCAIGHELVNDAFSLPDQAEVALIPPVSGG